MSGIVELKKVLAVIAITIVCSHATLAAERSADFFERRIRPLLIERCGECHGADEPQNGLSLTSVDGIAKGGSTGPTAIPGKPDQSPLIQAVRYTAKLKMPPDARLPSEEIELLQRWVRDGAVLPGTSIPVRAGRGDKAFSADDREWWAFQPIRDPASPDVIQAARVRTPIDRFVLHKLESQGLSLSPKANRRILIRRVTVDLLGLPPTPEDVDEFLDDDRPDVYDRLVDRLLASPQYGERWGRHWLDIARYADTNGGGFDYVYPNAWRYRDYVVRALNSDKPYDQFLVDQLAGDLLPPTEDSETYTDRLAATGFLAIAPKGLGMQDKELMALDVVDDQIDVLGRSLMGLTLACARCHDHKFDPIPTSDYYALAGIFRSTVSVIDTDKNPSYWPERPFELPSVTQARNEYQTRKSAHEKAITDVTKQANAELIAAARQRQLEYMLAASRLMRLQDDAPAVAHWTFDEVNDRAVKASTGPDGVLSNVDSSATDAIPVPTDGQLGKALRFDGQKEVVAIPAQNSPLTFGTSTDFSVSFWLRTAKGYTPQTADTLMAAKYQAAMWFVALRPGGYNGIYLRHSAGKRSIDIKPSSDQLAKLADARWHHVAFTSDRDGSGNVFIDGQQTGNVAISTVSQKATFNSPQTFRIGAETNGFRGSLDDVALWNRLLTPVEIKQLYARAVDSTPAHNVAQVEAERRRLRDTARRDSPRFNYDQAAKNGLVPSIVRRFVSLLSIAQADERNALHALAVSEPTAVDEVNVLIDKASERLRQLFDDEKQTPFIVGDDARQFYSEAAQTRLASFDAEADAIAKMHVPDAELAMIAFDAEAPADLRVHIAGDRNSLGKLIPRRFPRIVATSMSSSAPTKEADQSSIPKDQSGRLELARWLTSRSHPLTARVMANRVWQWHFGEGLVRTPDNFGRLGERPSHPELLDWIASQLVNGGWSVKQLHRQILLSAAYRQTTGQRHAHGNGSQSIDSANQLLWRMNRRRLEAEALRDSILATSGQLDLRIGGTVNDWKPKMFSVDDVNAETANYHTNRRSIYLPVVRGAAVHEMLQVFDFGDPNSITARREVTTVAPQALFLMNSPFVIEQARYFAERLLHRADLDSRGRIQLAYRLALLRGPSNTELDRAEQFIADADNKDAAWQMLCQSLFCLNEFAHVD
ncbi:MAG: DUF1553 domain-containing protein [Planctomycetes bacterium]|nr:DUF1553 domain-containing protein [Planctomycetota bacterium]